MNCRTMVRQALVIGLLSGLVSACGGGGGGGGGSGNSTPTIAPLTLLSSDPANNATGVNRIREIYLTFSTPLNSGTATSSIQLREANQASALPATINVTGSNVTVIPGLQLKPLTSYIVSASTGLRGTNGAQLSAAASTTFTTRDGAWQTATQIGSSVGGSSYPQIAMIYGMGVAVWQQSDGTRQNIWANRYTLGSGWGTPVLIENIDTGDAISPQVAIDANGNALVVWQQQNGNGYDILANRFTVGSGWGNAVLIEAGAGGAQYPKIAVNSNGNGLAVWQQSDGNFDHVWVNRYTPVNGWGTPVQIATNNLVNAWNPQIAIDANGNALAVWAQFDGAYYSIYASRYTFGGNWDAPVLIETSPQDANYPQVAFDPSGNALAIWEQSTYPNNNRYTVGSGWGSASGFAGTIAPQIAIDPNGNAMSVSFSGSNVGSFRYTVAGGWGPSVNINTAPIPYVSGYVSGPQIVVDPYGNALAVWQQFDGTRYNIHANRYTLGSGWGTPVLIETGTGEASNPQIAIDASGNALAVWQQSDGTRNNIWASRFE